MARLRTGSLRVLALCGLAVLAHALHAADPPRTVRASESRPLEPASAAPKSTTVEEMWVPPAGRPTTTTESGGTRGAPPNRLALRVLAPLQQGLTADAAPTLYWYVSAGSAASIELSVKHEDAIDPLLEVSLPAPPRAGVYSASLAEHGLMLEAGESYEWSVELLESGRRNRAQPYSSTELLVAPPDPSVAAAIGEAAEPIAKARVLAANGYWNDAFDTLYAVRDAKAVDPYLAKLLSEVSIEPARVLER